jgi:hypothetical protein
MQDYIYDIEIYTNIFLVCVKNISTKEKYSFEISPRKQQTKELVEFLNQPIRLIGFNNQNYDNLLIQKFLENLHLKGKDLVSLLKSQSDKIITNEKYSKFCKKLTKVPTIDLFLLHHFDNDARRCSLKELEFVFNMDNIQELPFDYTKPVPIDQFDTLVNYCWNDIEATHRLYNYSLEDIKLREELSSKYNIDMLSYNSPKIGEKSFALALIAKNPSFEQKLKLQTPRTEIKLNDIIFPYVSFEFEGFQRLLQYFKSKVITDTYKTFSEIPFGELSIIEGFYNVHKTKGVQANLNIVYQGFEFVFGTGGIHGCIEAGIYESDQEYDILDIDVSSYYPNIGIENKLYPEHLGVEFCDVYEERYDERGQYPKGNVWNSSIKFELNGVYGKSNSKFSPFYDPKYTMTITVNGQLLIAMLAEQLMNHSQLLQVNTDGVTIKVLKSNLPIIHQIIKNWEKLTKLTLETANYSKMVIKDVSNYLAIYTNSKVKRKGAAFKTKVELALHENYSGLIINEAISAYFINGTDPIQFMMQDLEQNGLTHFFMRAKVQRDHKLVARDVEDTTLQRITRYVVTNTGVSLIKIMPPLPKNPEKWRETEIEAGWKCTPCNNLSLINIKEIIQNLNLEYYLTQINKVINAINKKQNTEGSNTSNNSEQV